MTTHDTIAELDSERESERLAARQELTAQGEAAVAAIIESIGELNQRLLRAEDSERNMAALERRIHVLREIRSERAIRTIVDALADSAGAVDVLARQIDELYDNPNPVHRYSMLPFVTYRKSVAKSLNDASIRALAAYGKSILPHVDKYMGMSDPPAQRALTKVRRRVRFSWLFFPWLRTGRPTR